MTQDKKTMMSTLSYTKTKQKAQYIYFQGLVAELIPPHAQSAWDLEGGKWFELWEGGGGEGQQYIVIISKKKYIYMIIVVGVHDTLFDTYFKNWLIVVLLWAKFFISYNVVTFKPL